MELVVKCTYIEKITEHRFDYSTKSKIFFSEKKNHTIYKNYSFKFDQIKISTKEFLFHRICEITDQFLLSL